MSQNLFANMEGFHRDSHIYPLMVVTCISITYSSTLCSSQLLIPALLAAVTYINTYSSFLYRQLLVAALIALTYSGTYSSYLWQLLIVALIVVTYGSYL